MKIKPYSKLYSDKTGISTDVFTRDQMLEAIEQCAQECMSIAVGPSNVILGVAVECAEKIRKLKGELL